MDYSSVYQSYVENAALTSPEDEAFGSVVFYFVIEAETFDQIGSLIEFLPVSGKKVRLVYLTVVSAPLTHHPLFGTGRRLRVSADAAGVDGVGLLEAVLYPDMFGDIPVGHMDVGEDETCSVVQGPTYRGHYGRITKGPGIPFQFQLNLSLVISLVAGLAQGHEVVRAVAPGLP